jgi:hypothetical protein
MVIEEKYIMPSLFDSSVQKTNVSANYGKMTVQQTYGTGIKFTNFGTRNLRVIKVSVSGTDLRYQNGTDSTAGDFTASLSKFTLAVRALQTVAEIYAVFTPDASNFMAIISDDTANDSEDGVNAVSASGAAIWGDAEKVIGESTGATVTISTASIAGATLSWSSVA